MKAFRIAKEYGANLRVRWVGDFILATAEKGLACASQVEPRSLTDGELTSLVFHAVAEDEKYGFGSES